ncbi:cytochrome c oxidase assembly protein [Propylenella binzhouense]|uniref:cytochrome c oxidase assembly protein n=1 Tax=Propylenella binzhouense TaxID=2555902 RepID=UPI001368E80F
MRKLILTLALAAISDPAGAHAGGGRADFSWSLEPWVLASLGAAALAYGIGLARIRAEAGDRIVGGGNVAAFLAGLAVLFTALASPVDTLSDDLFSMHMVQHLLLMLVAAPLMVWSRPFLVFLWALPRSLRRSFGRFPARRGAARALNLLSHPVFVWSAFCGVFAFWHIPGPYGLALRHESVHILEHACFFASGYAFWAVVMSPGGRRRLEYGASVLYVGTAAVLSGLPGALIILTDRPFYPIHAEGAARWGLTALEDQHLAGLIMWIPAGFIYLAAICILFALWMREADRRAAAFARSMPTLAALIACAALLGGCGEGTEASSEAGGIGNVQRGAALISQFGCPACHTIPGIAGADGLVGPPLTKMGRRGYVAGVLRNTPENMTRWIRRPQAIVPGNAMPDMGISEDQARDITAYLYTLR